MASKSSISFDRAASYYDKTRALSPETTATIAELVRSELAGRVPVLEVGVGTGRIALPLHELGIEMRGLDLAPNMLARLMENAGGHMPFPLVQGDATRLPFRNGCFGGSIAFWVLHLVSGWRDVLSEMVRVVRSGGILLIDVGSEHDSLIHTLTWKFRDIAQVTDWPIGVKSYEEVDEALGAMGAQHRPLDPIPEVIESSIEQHIALLQAGIYSVAWSLEEEARKRAAAELREWAAAEYGSLDETRQIEATHYLRAYDL